MTWLLIVGVMLLSIIGLSSARIWIVRNMDIVYQQQASDERAEILDRVRHIEALLQP